MINNKIADLICRLNIANNLNKKFFRIQYGKGFPHGFPTDIYNILNILNKENPNLLTYKLIYPNTIEIHLINPFSSLELISKPSRRLYIQAKHIRTLNRGFGFYILRTCQGLMTSHTALQRNLGGEILIKFK
jgi:ribosomal protein S8